LAIVLTNLAAVVDQQGRPAEAVGAIEEAAKLFADLSTKLGQNEEFQGNRSKVASRPPMVLRREDDIPSALRPEARQEGVTGDLRAAEEREKSTADPENFHGRRVRMPRRSNSFMASVMPGRRTPSMVDRDSCVRAMTLSSVRSDAINNQRASLSSTR